MEAYKHTERYRLNQSHERVADLAGQLQRFFPKDFGSMLPLCSICAACSVPSLLFNTVFLLFWARLLACHTAKALGKDPANKEAGT